MTVSSVPRPSRDPERALFVPWVGFPCFVHSFVGFRSRKTPVCGGSILVVSVSPESEPAGFSPPVQRPFGAPQGGADRLLMEEGNGCAGEELSRDCGFFGFRLSLAAQAGFSISRISQERCKALSLFKTQGVGNDLARWTHARATERSGAT